MKQIFKKISAIAASTLMVGMTMGVAAAASYPAPFVSGSSADVAIVYGTGAGVNPSDLVQATALQSDLASSIGSSGGTPSGDSVLIQRSTDNLNLREGLQDVLVGNVDNEDLPTLLADGTYIADDNDEFSFEQKIALGNISIGHWRDSDYESLVGLSSRTPTIGFKIPSNTYVLNYTLDFLEDVSSDIDTNNRMEDIEGSDLVLMGKTYYVSEFHNDSSSDATKFHKAILLDSATVGNVKEGETATISGKSVSIDWIDADEVVFMIDGERAPASGKLQAGQSYKLNDGSYIGVRDIAKLAVSGELGTASFSIGTGKVEINHGEDIKLNDDSITGVKGYLHKSSNKLDKIVIEWKTDDESFISPQRELAMPGFGAVKFSMNEFVRSEEEVLTIEKDSDTSIQLTMPLKKGTVTFNLLYSNASGDFEGIGKAADERLAVTNQSVLYFYEKKGGADWHEYFVATYNTSKEGESYLMKATISEDKTAGRNESTFYYHDGTGWVEACTEKAANDDCTIGDVSFTIKNVFYTSGSDEMVNITAGNNVNFNTAITPGGLTVYLPYSNRDTYLITSFGLPNSTDIGAISFNATETSLIGHNNDSFYLSMVGEDKEETLGAGTGMSFTLNDNSDSYLQVQHVLTTAVNAAGAGSGGAAGLELQDTGAYEAYVLDDVAPRVVHYTQPDEDWAEIYYPSGDSESYAEVYLTEEGSVMEGGSSALGEVLVKDTEVSSVSSKNLIVVGGSCINSVAATLVGSAACTADFTDATGVGSGQFLIQSFGDAYSSGKVALLVAGYEAADTINAVTYLKTQTVDTTAGRKYVGTSSTSAELVVE